jgi:hypothetical protein
MANELQLPNSIPQDRGNVPAPSLWRRQVLGTNPEVTYLTSCLGVLEDNR